MTELQQSSTAEPPPNGVSPIATLWWLAALLGYGFYFQLFSNDYRAPLIVAGGIGIGGAITGWTLSNPRWVPARPAVLSSRARRWLLVATVPSAAGSLVVSVMALQAQTVTVWMDLGMVPAVIVGSVGLDAIRRVFAQALSSPADE